MENSEFHRGWWEFTKNQYREGGLPKKLGGGELGQFANLRRGNNDKTSQG